MKNKKSLWTYPTISEISFPIDLSGSDDHPRHARNRVIPSQFSLITMPMGCNFIRNIGSNDDEF